MWRTATPFNVSSALEAAPWTWNNFAAPLADGAIIHIRFPSLPVADSINIRVIDGGNDDPEVLFVGHTEAGANGNRSIAVTSRELGAYYPGQPRELFIRNATGGDVAAVIVVTASMSRDANYPFPMTDDYGFILGDVTTIPAPE